MTKNDFGSAQQTVCVIGAGIGGLALGIRLQSLGFKTIIVEQLDAPGGRAYVRHQEGFVFDMGPTVITVPHFIEELFALEKGKHNLLEEDFSSSVRALKPLQRSGITGGSCTSRYCQIVPITPFYRIYFSDGDFFDYDGDPENTRKQILRIAPFDLAGYEKFHEAAGKIFERGFLDLGYTNFLDIGSMLKILPDLVKLDAVRNLFAFASSYFKSPKLRQVFSFETLLVGGSPLRVPAIYAMIHFVEKFWGIHYVMGGTGSLIKGLVKKFEELGGTLLLNTKVTKIICETEAGQKPQHVFQKTFARGVVTAAGQEIRASAVVSNADITNTYLKLVPGAARLWNSNLRMKNLAQSMSLFVIYFGFRATGLNLNLRHHNVILGPRYEGLLEDIFQNKVLSKDFSQYLHLPTLTDPSLAPEGCHAAYTLIPVPHLGANIDWQSKGDEFCQKILAFLEDEGYIPELRERLVTLSYVTPKYFENVLDSYLGNAFGVEPVLHQSAFFRPHNRSEDVSHLYCVGAGTQPGAGTPSVMMSAKMTARAIAKDFGLLDESLNG